MKKNRVVLVKKLNACGQTNIIGSSLVVLAKGIFRVKCTYVSKPAEKLCIVYGKHLSRDNGASSIKTLALWNVTFYVRCPISRWITKNHLQNTYVFTRRKSFRWDICLNLPRTIFFSKVIRFCVIFLHRITLLLLNAIVMTTRCLYIPLPRKFNIFRILRHIFCTELKFNSLNLILYKDNAIAFKNIRNNLFPLRFYILRYNIYNSNEGDWETEK